mmetsp:Transcript_39511/g.93794  ORF Transcript_39511/g.93794 Transcript_39511/m.93794 type:complete len:204 (-) Transcript_39511:779-1390(-)
MQPAFRITSIWFGCMPLGCRLGALPAGTSRLVSLPPAVLAAGWLLFRLSPARPGVSLFRGRSSQQRSRLLVGDTHDLCSFTRRAAEPQHPPEQLPETLEVVLAAILAPRGPVQLHDAHHRLVPGGEILEQGIQRREPDVADGLLPRVLRRVEGPARKPVAPLPVPRVAVHRRVEDAELDPVLLRDVLGGYLASPEQVAQLVPQ